MIICVKLISCILLSTFLIIINLTFAEILVIFLFAQETGEVYCIFSRHLSQFSFNRNMWEGNMWPIFGLLIAVFFLIIKFLSDLDYIKRYKIRLNENLIKEKVNV